MKPLCWLGYHDWPKIWVKQYGTKDFRTIKVFKKCRRCGQEKIKSN